MRTDETSADVVGDDGEGASRRRFREELAQIPTLHHAVYGDCLAPVYPSQLLIALGQLADLPIGAWRSWVSAKRVCSPDFDGFALAHSVGKPFPAQFAIEELIG